MEHFEIHGTLGSPYSMKVRAAFRAKRLPYIWKLCNPLGPDGPTKQVKVPVIPVIKTPKGDWVNDSTPLLLDLEQEGRPLLPPSPALRFACYLIEDMADEWMVKAMFHYRWTTEDEDSIVPAWLLYDACLGLDETTTRAMGKQFAGRQIGRMPKVGCTPDTAAVIEDSLKRTLEILEEAAKSQPHFLFGDMASLADVAVFGQLSQLKSDPEPSAMLQDDYPFLYRWLDHVDDASGFEGEWGANFTPALSALIKQAGDTYLPVLAANEAAFRKGESTFTVDLEEGYFTAETFKYHVRCIERLRQEWIALGPEHREEVSEHLGGGTEFLDSVLAQSV